MGGLDDEKLSVDFLFAPGVAVRVILESYKRKLADVK